MSPSSGLVDPLLGRGEGGYLGEIFVGRKWAGFLFCYQSARAALTKCHRLGGLSTGTDPSLFLEADGARPQRRQVWFFLKSLSLPCRWFSSLRPHMVFSL